MNISVTIKYGSQTHRMLTYGVLMPSQALFLSGPALYVYISPARQATNARAVFNPLSPVHVILHENNCQH